MLARSVEASVNDSVSPFDHTRLPARHATLGKLGTVCRLGLASRGNTRLEPDGTFRIVVAHRDPGLPNWIETTGLTHLSVNVRAVRPEIDELDVRFRREKLAALTTTG